jgi:hypothetical protein
MVAGQLSARPSSAAGIAVVDGRVATMLGLWILIVSELLARRGSMPSLGTPWGSRLRAGPEGEWIPVVPRTEPSFPLCAG